MNATENLHCQVHLFVAVAIYSPR